MSIRQTINFVFRWVSQFDSTYEFSQSVRIYVLCDALEGVLLIIKLFVENINFESIFSSLYLVG